MGAAFSYPYCGFDRSVAIYCENFIDGRFAVNRVTTLKPIPGTGANKLPTLTFNAAETTVGGRVKSKVNLWGALPREVSHTL